MSGPTLRKTIPISATIVNLRSFLQKATAPTADRINPAELAAAKRVNIIAGSMGTVFAVLTGAAFLTGFVKELGASHFQVGLLAGTVTLAQFIQIPASILIERLKRRKFCWFWTAICHRLLWWIIVFLPYSLSSPRSPSAVWIVIGVSMAAWLCAHASGPSWLAWMGSLIPEPQRGSFFGRRQAFTQMATLVAMLFSGYLLDWFPAPSEEGGSYTGYSLVFGLGALVGCVDIIIHMAIPEPTPRARKAGRPLRLRLLAPFRNSSFRRFILVIALFIFGAQVVNPFGVVYCLEELNLSWSFIVSTLGAVNLLAAIAGSFLWAWVTNRYGHKPVFLMTIPMGAGNSLLWFLVSPVPVLIGLPGAPLLEIKSFYIVVLVLHVIGGFVWSGFQLAAFNLLLGLSPERDRSIHTAVYATVAGVTGSLGAVVGGSLSQVIKAKGLSVSLTPYFSYGWWHLLILIAVACWLVTFVLALRIPRPDEAPSGVVFSRLFAGNPMRTFYHLYTLSSSGNPEKRAYAVRRLGETRSALAIRDLIQALDDPHWEVRRESALSLGQIQDPESLKALVAHLNDPDSDVRTEAARSLGRLGGPEAAEALLEHLSDPSREVRLEVVRSLGALAYPPAQNPLLKLLVREEDSRIRAAAATALGRLGNVHAVLDMIEALATSEAPRAQEEIARAIGHMLSVKNEFERMLRREEGKPGSSLQRLYSAIRSTLPREPDEAGNRIDEIWTSLRDSYLEENWVRAAGLLHRLAECYARQRHGFVEGDMDALCLHLFNRDWLLGACLFYTMALQQSEDSDLARPTQISILLGLFFLYRACQKNGISLPPAELPGDEPGQ